MICETLIQSTLENFIRNYFMRAFCTIMISQYVRILLLTLYFMFVPLNKQSMIHTSQKPSQISKAVEIQLLEYTILTTATATTLSRKT